MEVNTIANSTNRRTPTLGFFIPSFGTYQESTFGGYQEAIWNGITQVAEEYNANVLCFAGSELNSPVGYYRHWNVIYDLASPATLDGLIVLSAVVQNHVTVEETAQFCARYAPLPMVSIGLELEGISSITVDNFVGLRKLMEHLLEHHHYRRIAFVRGPEKNQEDKIRYGAYAEALQDYGIPLDLDLVVPGLFSIATGIEAIRLLLDQRKVSFEAVVASNDSMAIGAYQELTRRGINVPEDVAITGFDDVPEARLFATPLTTVHQPLVEQGQQAARMLLEYLHHGTPPESLALETTPIIRESCGCSRSAISGLAPRTSLVPTYTSKHALARQRKTTLADMQKTLCPYFPEVAPQSLKQLVDTFFDELQGKPDAQFLPIFGHVLRTGTMNLSRAEIKGGVMTRWREALSILREQARLYMRSDTTVHMEDELYQGCLLIIEVVERVHSNLRGRTEISMMIRSEALREINAESDIQGVVDVLAQNLPRLGIRTCFLALYEGEPTPPPSSKLIMAYHDGQRIELEPNGRLFRSEEVIPLDVLPGNKLPFLVVYPLMMRNTNFGFIAMNIGRRMALASTDQEFPEQIGSALHRALLLQQIKQSNEYLQQHAAELAEANMQLERFVYIASHDLQEPLRMVTSYLQLLKKRYQDRLDTDAQEFISYAVDGSIRMKRMIDALLAYSRVATRGQPVKPTDCEQLLAQALSKLEVTIKEHNALVTHDPLPTVMADGTQLMVVFQNLIENAIKFQADRQPHVHISAERREDEWLFSVQDNGIGIAPEFSERVFAVFSRLHPHTKYPGTGIGLAICKKVVERHRGRIWVESQPGEGTTFFFTIPSKGN